MKSDKTKIRIVILVLLVLGGLAMPYAFARPWSEVPFHETLERLMYIPVVLGAIWFGFAGGIGVTALVVLCALPLLVREWPTLSLDGKTEEIAEMLLLLLVGSVMGILRQRLHAEKESAEQISADLEGAYADLSLKTSQLLAADEQLRRGERLRLLGELSSELAHEIQNPLASIKGTAEILNDRCKRTCGTGEFLDILGSEIKRLRGVLDRFLDFARNQEAEISTCDPRKSLSDVVRLMSHQMEKQRIELHLESPEGPLAVCISDEQLKQVFLNIVLNAVQAMPEGGRIAAAFEERGTDLVMTFRDTGPGIKEANREQVFDAFFSTKRGGTGLGLAVVWRILKKNNGSIVLAPPGDTPGATFILTIPLAASANSAIAARSA